MSETRIAPSLCPSARMKLEPYSAEIRLAHLTVALDNIHYDVFLSPRFVEFTRKYLFDLTFARRSILLWPTAKIASSLGSPEHAAFRKLLTEILQESLTRAKFNQSIETDILHQLAC